MRRAGGTSGAGQPGATVTASDAGSLAVVIRQTQWLLDDTARDVPAGRLTPEKSQELAAILDGLAALVRKHGGHTVIDSPA